jgi:hypothetical protein
MTSKQGPGDAQVEVPESELIHLRARVISPAWRRFLWDGWRHGDVRWVDDGDLSGSAPVQDEFSFIARIEVSYDGVAREFGADYASAISPEFSPAAVREEISDPGIDCPR